MRGRNLPRNADAKNGKQYDGQSPIEPKGYATCEHDRPASQDDSSQSILPPWRKWKPENAGSRKRYQEDRESENKNCGAQQFQSAASQSFSAFTMSDISESFGVTTAAIAGEFEAFGCHQ